MTYCTPQFILSLVFVFWPGCHDTQSLLRGSFCQSPPLVAVQRHPASHCSGSVSLSRPLSTMLVNQHCLTSQLMLYFLQGAPCPHLTSFLASFIVLFSASHCCSTAVKQDSSAVNCPPLLKTNSHGWRLLCLSAFPASLSIDLPPIVVPVAASQVATPQAQFPRRAPVTAALKTTFTFPRENSSHSIDTTPTLTGDKTDWKS